MVEKKCFAMFCQSCQFFGCTPRLKRLNITMQPHAIHDQSFREQSHREPKRKLLKKARAHFLNMKKVCRIQNFKNFNPETLLR